MPPPGTNIRILRQQLGLSLRSLANAAEVDHGNLSKLERGEAGYSPEVLERIAKVLRVSLGVLFSETAAVEAAALRMRNVPVLTPQELLAWRGPESIPMDEDHRHLHADLASVSRMAFAIEVKDQSNAPWFEQGDDLLFDAGRQPATNDIVLGQSADAAIYIGRFHVLNESSPTPQFEIVPLNLRSSSVSTRVIPTLVMRGTLAELRRYFKRA